MAEMTLSSDAILETRAGGPGYFDPRYTCDSDNSSPELRWSDPPADTQGFVVLLEDASAEPSPLAHWLIYNIPVGIRHLPAGIPPQETLPNGIRQGVNELGKLGYTGPCPPHRHHTHSYIFRVYALRTLPDIPPRANREQLMSAIGPLILAEASLEARYQRLAQKAG